MTYYRRKSADASVLAAAVGAGAAIGAATFYLVKLWLQREPLEPDGESEPDDEPESDGEAEPDDELEGDDEGAERVGDSEPETSEGIESSR